MNILQKQKVTLNSILMLNIEVFDIHAHNAVIRHQLFIVLMIMLNQCMIRLDLPALTPNVLANPLQRVDYRSIQNQYMRV